MVQWWWVKSSGYYDECKSCRHLVSLDKYQDFQKITNCVSLFLLSNELPTYFDSSDELESIMKEMVHSLFILLKLRKEKDNIFEIFIDAVQCSC